MKIKTQIDAQSFIILTFMLVYRKTVTIVTSLIGLILLVVSLFFLVGKPLPGQFSVFSLIIGLYSVFFMPLAIYISAKKNYRKNSRLHEIVEYEFNYQSIVSRGMSFTTTQSWESIHKVRELRNWVLIYQTPAIFNAIPKSSFGENLQEFRNILKEKKLLKR